MIRIEGLSYTYDDGTHALKRVDMDFNAGRSIGIIGANGSGKSTLLLAVMGVIKASSGRITVQDELLKFGKKRLRQHRQHVNMVFQDPEKQIFFSRIYDDVAFGLRNLDMDEKLIHKKVRSSLDKVDMTPLGNKPVHFLSYGQKKRVSIAGILAMDPEDEPSSGLDPQMKESLKRIIHTQSRDRRIVVSSHDMDFIYEVCDYIYVLSGGQVIGEGTPTKVFLDKGLLERASLKMPWLAAIHAYLGFPLERSAKELFENDRRSKNEEGNNIGQFWNDTSGYKRKDD